MKKVRFALNIKELNHKPVVGFPLAKTFNETMAIDLKNGPMIKKIWLLHMIDHATRYSVSFITSKKKELIMKKIFQYWIGIFGHPNKILVDNGREFNNTEFQTLCENLILGYVSLLQTAPGVTV